MRADDFLADLLWDVDNMDRFAGKEVAALFVDVYNCADMVQFKQPMAVSSWSRMRRFNIMEDHVNRSKLFRNHLVVASCGSGRLLDMRDAIPPDEYSM
jgi:hypothetical protein